MVSNVSLKQYTVQHAHHHPFNFNVSLDLSNLWGHFSFISQLLALCHATFFPSLIRSYNHNCIWLGLYKHWTEHPDGVSGSMRSVNLHDGPVPKHWETDCQQTHSRPAVTPHHMLSYCRYSFVVASTAYLFSCWFSHCLA